ncbi:hypothetical protein HCJ76_43025 [Streptomyces sp. MC1]|nr:hypothetical protein [Streptomyces sp. MC1]
MAVRIGSQPTHKTSPACATRNEKGVARTCATCQGEGTVVHEQHTYKVRIPAGVKDRQKIRSREVGGPGKHGGAPRDLYVTVHVHG